MVSYRSPDRWFFFAGRDFTALRDAFIERADCTTQEGAGLNTLEISILRYGEVEAITLSGPLVLGASVDSLRQKMENFLDHGENQFVLNLTGVGRLDSSGIGLLVMILRSAKEAGGSLKLVNPSTQVTQVLRMCNLLPLFEVYGEEQEAIASFARV
jgi:anti-sigma B factor antagonist